MSRRRNLRLPSSSDEEEENPQIPPNPNRNLCLPSSSDEEVNPQIPPNPNRNLRLPSSSNEEEENPQIPPSPIRNLCLPSSSDEEENPQIPPNPNRNLLLPSSSEEEENPQIPPNPNTNPNPFTSPPPSPPQEILDDDDEEFTDVPEFLSDPSPPPNPNPNPNPSVDLIDGLLQGLGLRLRREWLESCVSALERSRPGFRSMDIDLKSRSCFEQFLLSDMNCCGAGVLPENVGGMHKAELEGPFVLQVDEIVNVCSSLRERYHDAPAGLKRCLKLSLTDGVRRVFAMEYRPIRDLEVFAPAGLKVVVRNIHIRRGLLMLVPEVTEILGGVVEDLEAARQRLVLEVNKPPRSKRRRTIPPLSERATLAAWPPVNNGSTQANIATPLASNNSQQTAQAANVGSLTSGAGSRIIGDFHVGDIRWNTIEESNARGIEESTLPDSLVPPNTVSFIEEPTAANSTHHAEPNTTISTTSTTEDTSALDVEDEFDDLEYPLILSGDKEMPFTYLACLLAKWVTQKDHITFIQGTIKCTLTGVKRFQYKQRSMYELQVYVDDGSLISEVTIAHQVVEKGIGHSTEEVTAALSSSDKQTATVMREAMKRFQLFLAKFEGTVLVEINKDSPFPIAREMNQGSSTSDALLLLRRLKELYSPPKPPHSHLNPINLSP